MVGSALPWGWQLLLSLPGALLHLSLLRARQESWSVVSASHCPWLAALDRIPRLTVVNSLLWKSFKAVPGVPSPLGARAGRTLICCLGVEKVQSLFQCWMWVSSSCQGGDGPHGHGWGLGEVTRSSLAGESPSLVGEEHLRVVSCLEWLGQSVLRVLPSC